MARQLHQTLRRFIVLTVAVFVTALPLAVADDAVSSKIGIVIMHGKGGSPTRYVSDLASSLEKKEYLVANLEMPWSGRRNYDVSVSAAEREVESALAGLRSKGAQKLFVAGHSQGGMFALHFGGKQPLAGVIAIAPGGSTDGPDYRTKLGESVARARKLVAEGKGDEKTTFLDFEASKGAYPIVSIPAAYLSWFEPDGPMNILVAAKGMNPQVPVLFIVPTNDYPGLLRMKQRHFNSLPSNRLTKLYEPDSSHLNAPFASRDEIVRWTTEVAGKTNPALQGARDETARP
jgi:pimeloyl-ACP methyl ester carboxylesterase